MYSGECPALLSAVAAGTNHVKVAATATAGGGGGR